MSKWRDDSGELFLLAGLQSHQPAQELLLDRMSERVTVTGTLVKDPKAQMLYIDSVRRGNRGPVTENGASTTFKS